MEVMLMSKFNKEVEEFFRKYQDRGMVKWAGFYLSDHVLKMSQQSKRDAYVEVKKEEMSIEDISKILMKAFSEYCLVSVQLSTLDVEGSLQRSFQGHLLGIEEDNVIIDDHVVCISDINHVEVCKKIDGEP